MGGSVDTMLDHETNKFALSGPSGRRLSTVGRRNSKAIPELRVPEGLEALLEGSTDEGPKDPKETLDSLKPSVRPSKAAGLGKSKAASSLKASFA